MDHVDLDRLFIAVTNDEESSLADDSVWASLLGALHWRDILKSRRVVLLAEASSGKTREFQGTAEALRSRGEKAFFCTVEQLAERELDRALKAPDLTTFNQWKSDSTEAWFFIDSVDEARLTHKRFEDALNSLARGLDRHLARAHVLVSCRMSDWRGSGDRQAILECLPVPKTADEPEPPSPHEALLAPILEKHSKSTAEKRTDEDGELLVVRLVALNRKQQIQYATALGVTSAVEFVDAVVKAGLDAWAERPGDLEYLARYWGGHRRFEALSVMIENSIHTKLAELDEYRPDNDTLSEQKARSGAERLAGALTLCKATTFDAPAQDADPTLTAGALPPGDILPDWAPSERNALLRRGAFAPGTYGRIRLHHRSTQEYLTACWLDRMFDGHASTVNSLLFAERYGVETVVPALRPAAAWLALRRDAVRDDIMRREPMLLLQHGDPRPLPASIRGTLLIELAKRHAAGEISDDHVDNRSLWAFSTPEIAVSVREAWELNDRADFRLDLLRIIREGGLGDCADLASAILWDNAQSDYHRIVAAQALRACEKWEELDALAEAVEREPKKLSPRVMTELAKVLFPRSLSVDQLMRLIHDGPEPGEYSTEGFNYAIDELWAACPAGLTLDFIEGLVDLGKREPHVGEYECVSQRHESLIQASTGPSASFLEELGDADPPEAIVALCLLMQTAARYGARDEDMRALAEQVNRHPKVQRALFWATANAQRERGLNIEALWQLFPGETLWRLDSTAIPWLLIDIESKADERDRRLALNAVLEIHREARTLQSSLGDLRELTRGDAVLEADLAAAIGSSTGAFREESERTKQRRRRIAAEQAKNAQAWRKFRDEVVANPKRIEDADAIRDRDGFSLDLFNLTDWLRRHVDCTMEMAPLHWRELAPVFSEDAARSYRAGMQLVWRITPPEAPIRKEGGGISTKWATILSIGAIGMEAKGSATWYRDLKPEEVERAALHACLTEREYPIWLDTLVEQFPAQVVPIIAGQLATEWARAEPHPIYVLHRFANAGEAPLPAIIKPTLVKVFANADPPSLVTLDYGSRMVLRAGLSEADTETVRATALERYQRHAGLDHARAVRYLAILLALDAERATDLLGDWIDQLARSGQTATAQEIIGALFGAHDPLAPIGSFSPSPTDLETMVLVAYRAVDPSQDQHHEGTYTPNARDDAESGRNTVLKLLAESVGEEAYRAMLRLANHTEMSPRRIRFLEIARGMAERDADLAPYSVAQVVRINDAGTLPIRSQDDLYAVAIEVLENIAWSFDHEDASSRAVLETAEDENAVQEWLAEQFRLRANGRYHVHRESEVAEENMPDVLLSSTDGMFEVAIEAKHGDKGWTVKTLRDALKEQLVEDYLRPPQRRRGILVITRHAKGYWIDPDTGARLDVPALISVLNGLADTLTTNAVGPVKACVRGMDAKPRARRRGSNQT